MPVEIPNITQGDALPGFQIVDEGPGAVYRSLNAACEKPACCRLVVPIREKTLSGVVNMRIPLGRYKALPFPIPCTRSWQPQVLRGIAHGVVAIVRVSDVTLPIRVEPVYGECFPIRGVQELFGPSEAELGDGERIRMSAWMPAIPAAIRKRGTDCRFLPSSHQFEEYLSPRGDLRSNRPTHSNGFVILMR